MASTPSDSPWQALRSHLRLLVLAPPLAGALALAVTFAIPPSFTAVTSFLPPQQQGGAASALASLGALAGLAGTVGGAKTPADQFVALMRSVTVSDRIIDQFGLQQAYGKEFRIDTRKALDANVRFQIGKKDGLITIEVDDTSPKQAAAMANRYVDELRKMTNTIALTDAQQRRVFFEKQLELTRDKLGKAQQALQSSGVGAGTLKAEPKAAAEGYAKLRAEATAAEVRLQTLRNALSDTAPEVLQQLATLRAMRDQLAKLEATTADNPDPGYISKYREFKYQETLYDLFARQYELARVDESREGALIQVVDPAQVPEKKSKPKRIIITLSTVAAVLLAALVFALVRGTRGLAARAEDEASGAPLASA